MGHPCTHLNELNNLQSIIIKKHIDKYKYYRHIENIEEALLRFLQEWTFAVGEIYCRKCEDKFDCDGYREKLKEEPPISNEQEFDARR